MTRAKAKDVMTAPVLAVQPDMSVHELAAFLSANQISGAPVLDAAHHVVGVVSTTDLAQVQPPGERIAGDRSDPERQLRGWEDRLDAEDLKALHVEEDELFVRDIMTPAIYTVKEDAPASVLARTMVAGRIHRLFVTRAGRVVGVVTSLDLLKLL